MSDKNRYIDWLVSLRAVAIIGVLVIQVATPAVREAYGENMGAWWTAHILNSAVRFAVPLFLMISGATLLTREYKLKEFYKKRAIRILPPLLFFSAVYLVYNWYTMPQPVQPSGISGIWGWIKELFLAESISNHFWFVYMILFLYLVTPFVGAFVRKLKPEMIVFLLAAWILMSNISQGYSVNMHAWTWSEIPKKFYVYILYLGYMVLGYYFHSIFYVSKNIRFTAFILYLATVIITLLVVFFTSRAKSHLDLSFYSYLNLNTIIQTSAVFISLKHTTIKCAWLDKVVFRISDYSYGIYLVHALVLSALCNIGVAWTTMHATLSIPLILILTLAISMGIVFILRKIPYGKFISG